jgi:hypothetical protein
MLKSIGAALLLLLTLNIAVGVECCCYHCTDAAAIDVDGVVAARAKVER